MTDSLLAPAQEVLYKRCPSQRSLSQIRLPLLPVPTTRRAPRPGSMFSFSAWSGTATRACCGCVVPRDVLPLFRNIAARTERRVQRTLPFGPYFLRTKLFVGHRGQGVFVCLCLCVCVFVCGVCGVWGGGFTAGLVPPIHCASTKRPPCALCVPTFRSTA